MVLHFIVYLSQIVLFSFRFPQTVRPKQPIMSLTNGHSVSKETWDSHNKMLLEPLSHNDPEVCIHWINITLVTVTGRRHLEISAVMSPFT